MILKCILLLYMISGLEAVSILVSWTKSLKIMDSENKSNTSMTIPTHYAIAVDYHFRRGEIYYSDAGKIYRAWLSGHVNKKDPVIIAEVMIVDGLAVDWINDNLYWADSTRKMIEVSNLDGVNRKVLFGPENDLEAPRAVVVDPSEGMLFWSDWGTEPSVSASGLDGKAPKTLTTSVVWPNGLTLDLSKKKLYIIDGSKGQLMSVNYDGTGLKMLSTSSLMNNAFGLTFYANKLYWTSWAQRALVMMDLESHVGSQQLMFQRWDLAALLERMMGVKVIHPSLQPESLQADPCRNKGCSHFCLPGLGATSSCGCPFGFNLTADGITCVEQGYLLVSFRKVIRRFNIETVQLQLLTDLPRAAIALDYHLKKGLVFWSDVEEHRIYRAPIDQLNNKTVIVTTETCDGLAVDWVHDVLYWTDTSDNALYASTLDGQHRTALVNEDLDQPRAVAVDPNDGSLFWSDWGENPKIERSNLDASRRQTIVSDNIKWPNGITLDYVEKKLYWVDGHLETLESCFYDGSERKSFVGAHRTALQPFAITMFKDNLYWSDWGKKKVFKTSKYPSSSLSNEFTSSNDSPPHDIKVVHSSRQKNTIGNPCSRLNCQGLCLGSLGGARCFGDSVLSPQDTVPVSTSNPQIPVINELDTLTTIVGNDSFKLFLNIEKRPSWVNVSLSCVKRQGCNKDNRCSESNAVTKQFTNNEDMPYTITGLLPATKYNILFRTPNNVREFHLTTSITYPPELPTIRSVEVIGSEVTIKWDPVDTCVPDFEFYNYKIYKANDFDTLIRKGSTTLTETTEKDLEPEEHYTVRLYTTNENHYVSTLFQAHRGNMSELCRTEELLCDNKKDCANGEDEDVNICAGIETITVYKKTKSEAYLRCEVTNRTAKNLLKFNGKYTVEGSSIEKKFDVPAEHCTLWPNSFCFHLSSLQEKKEYNIHLSAVLRSGTEGNPVRTSVFTKEGVPGPPEDLQIVNYLPTEIEIQWRSPNQTNGELRNIIVNLQETETTDEELCCQSFPLVEIPVSDEEPVYSTKLVGLTPASSYAISVMAKTVYMGTAKEIDGYTSPPPLKILTMVDILVPSISALSWERRQDKPSTKTVYHSLVKSYLLLLYGVGKNHQIPPKTTNIDIGPLHPLLEKKIGPGFSVIWRTNADDTDALNKPYNVTGLMSRKGYKLAWVQVSQYKSTFGVDYITSEPFYTI